MHNDLHTSLSSLKVPDGFNLLEGTNNSIKDSERETVYLSSNHSNSDRGLPWVNTLGRELTIQNMSVSVPFLICSINV